MTSKDKIIEEKQFLSDRLSSQTRLVTFGVLGTMWGFLISDVEIAKLIVERFGKSLILIIFLSLLVLCIDYLQYLTGYFNTHNLIKKLENKGLSEGQYDSDSFSYKLRDFCFYTKQILLGINILVFIIIIGKSFTT